MIGTRAQHTQGFRPMKDNPQRWRSPRLAMLAVLLPLALGSTAQNPPPVESAMPLPTVVTTPVARPPVAEDQVSRVEIPSKTRPAPEAFDVPRFEPLAQALVSNGRVPGLALAIVR